MVCGCRNSDTLTLTQEDFYNILWATMDSSGQLASIWFVIIIVIGSLFLLNYSTAVVTRSYMATTRRK